MAKVEAFTYLATRLYNCYRFDMLIGYLVDSLIFFVPLTLMLSLRFLLHSMRVTLKMIVKRKVKVKRRKFQWLPESLGPFDLDIASSKYQNEDFSLSDSLGGLSNLIACRLDAFQSCSLFALNKKDSTSKIEAPGSASLADFKIDTGV